MSNWNISFNASNQVSGAAWLAFYAEGNQRLNTREKARQLKKINTQQVPEYAWKIAQSF